MFLCCNIMVASLWCHLEHHELGGAKANMTLSSSIVNNEENWLP